MKQAQVYETFLNFVRSDLQRHRSSVNRRMFHVFFWCFLLPAALYVVLLVLMKGGILPRSARSVLDWIVLIFPIAYSSYVLGTEVLSQVPAAFRSGGVAHSLGQSVEQNQWRARVCEELSRAIPESPHGWRWIAKCYQVDLDALQGRTRHLTALAGAVFFLLIQGIDSLALDDSQKAVWTRAPLLGWVENAPDLSQFVALAIFLILLYLSGSQNLAALRRYQDCAELLALPSES